MSKDHDFAYNTLKVGHDFPSCLFSNKDLNFHSKTEKDETRT